MNILLLGLALANITSSPTAVVSPEHAAPEPIKMTVIATAYTPRPEETDSTPWLTAAGTRTREGIIASNNLPFGTKVRIKGKIYTVEDRMNRKYTNAVPARIDIVFMSLEKARQFGKREIEIEILRDADSPDGIRIGKADSANDA